MKTITTFSFSICLGLLIQTSDVYSQTDPIPLSSNGVWLIGYGSWNPFGEFVYYDPYGIAITDTVSINDTTYFKLSGIEYCDGVQVSADYFLLREDSGKYYYKYNEQAAEHLWFDFTLELGELIEWETCSLWPGETETLTVIAIDEIALVDGSIRRKWTLQYSDIESSYYALTEEWIEGIGNFETGLLHPLVQTCGTDMGYWLRCYIENDEWLAPFQFFSTGTDCCTTTQIETISNTQVGIFPNPAMDILRVSDIENHQVSVVRITDTTGRLAITEYNKQQIDVSSLAVGIYFIEIVADDNRIVQRFVKE